MRTLNKYANQYVISVEAMENSAFGEVRLLRLAQRELVDSLGGPDAGVNLEFSAQIPTGAPEPFDMRHVPFRPGDPIPPRAVTVTIHGSTFR